MKAIKMLMMAAITIMSLNLFAQDTTKIKEQKAEKLKYECPMHPDVVMDGPGKCATCGMDLTLSPKEKMKREVMKIYSCPMHSDVTSNKPGKCSKCGMDLREKAN